MRFGAIALGTLIAALACSREPSPPLVIGTTTSVADSGLLAHLSGVLQREEGITLRWHSVGSGRALKMAEAGEVDVAITHDSEAEKRVLGGGSVLLQKSFMKNDFVIVGPMANPAGIMPADSAVAAMHKVAASGSRFCSRGDESGTHAREKKLWKAASVDPASNPGYLIMGQPMGALLRSADQQEAYALTDRATFESLQNVIRLRILCEGDPLLENIYTVTVMKRSRPDGDALRFARWLSSDRGREAIFAYRPKGKVLFHPISD